MAPAERSASAAPQIIKLSDAVQPLPPQAQIQ
jgi:hypothetical protein